MDNYLEDVLKQNTVRDIDFHGRRIVNAGVSKNFRDYVTREELLEALAIALKVALPDDTDLVGPPTGLTITKQTGNSSVAGNAFQVSFYLPNTQIKSYDGYTVILTDSNILQNSDQVDNGTNGDIQTGVNELYDGTKSWVVNSLVGNDVVVFGPKTRAGFLRSFAYEGVIFQGHIISNTADTIKFVTRPDNFYTFTNLEYKIVAPGDHWYDKVKFYTPLEFDNYSPSIRKVRFSAGIQTVYVWVIPHNYWGYGIAAGWETETFAGVSTAEIKLLAIDNGRVAALAITFDKINVSQLSAISADIGSVTAGTITGTTIRTAASGQRITLDSTNGLRAYDSGGNVNIQIPVGGVTGMYMGGTTGASGTGVFGTNVSVDFYINGTEYAAITNAGFVTVGSGVYTGNGSGLTTLAAGNISSGSLADARLSSNIPLKNAANTFSGANVFNTSVNIFTAGLTAYSPVTLVSANLDVSVGYGVAAGNQSIAFPANGVELYVNAGVGFKLRTSAGANETLAQLHDGSSLRTIKIFNDGTRDLLYLA